MIQLKGVSKTFKKRTAIDGLSLDLESGCYGLLGPNGAGKTTLIRCILGLYQFSGGIIEMDENLKIGYLPQKFGMFNELKVRDMLKYFAMEKRVPKDKRDEEIERVLDMVNLDDRIDDKISKLSGGMQRRIGIAQALLGNPDLLIFDEPTTGLDPEERAHFKEIIQELKEQKKTILISTHIVDDVEHICDRGLIMYRGRLLENLPIDQISEFSNDEEKTLEKGYIQRMKDEKRGSL